MWVGHPPHPPCFSTRVSDRCLGQFRTLRNGFADINLRPTARRHRPQSVRPIAHHLVVRDWRALMDQQSMQQKCLLSGGNGSLAE